jgi:hypothetical protein
MTIGLSALPASAQVSAHRRLQWKGSDMCLQCHAEEARDVHGSSHYQWEGLAPYNADGPALQGKKRSALNSYCVNILGNWGACGTCHVGLGLQPTATADTTQLKNIDCLMCHNDRYRRKKDPATGRFVPDLAAMQPLGITSLDQLVRMVQPIPTRSACLQCHAKAGGGDNNKRGDIALAHANTTDRNFDVHMATTGANLPCTGCHAVENHRIAGRGSDLRETDYDVTMTCSNGTCHTSKATTSGHGNEWIGRHVQRVACQTCHIGAASARNAADTVTDESTEVHRDWTKPYLTASGAYHPEPQRANNIKPEYRFWNKYNDNYNLEEVAVVDPATGRYGTSRPFGAVTDTTPDTKLYPFKYKTAYQPFDTYRMSLVPLDTSKYFAGQGLEAAVVGGLANMGWQGDPWAMVTTDTFQLLTHEIAPKANALRCNSCHGSTATQVNLKSLGYTLKASTSVVCTQCHGQKEAIDWYKVHEKHVKDKQYDCSFCHGFTRPERNLRTSR